MPLSKGAPRVLAVAAALIIVAVVIVADAWSQSAVRAPREIRNGLVDMVIQRVEPTVSQEEIREAVQAQLDRETLCIAWPGVWLEDTGDRREFYARFDLMARDWGADVASEGEARMQEFVAMGLMRAEPQRDGGVTFRLTASGGRFLRGSPYTSTRPKFCLPTERRVVEITTVEHGDFPCGTLLVRFTHAAEAWPAWAASQRSQERVAQAWGAPGGIGEGLVTMSRQWFSDTPPDGRGNGQLRSLCYDTREREVSGDDLELYAATPGP